VAALAATPQRRGADPHALTINGAPAVSSVGW